MDTLSVFLFLIKSYSLEISIVIFNVTERAHSANKQGDKKRGAHIVTDEICHTFHTKINIPTEQIQQKIT